MVSIKNSAKSHLKNMVKGAAEEISSTKKSSPSVKSCDETPPAFLSREVTKSLLEQIKKNGRTIQNIPIHLIDLTENIRKSYNDDTLSSLAESLKEDGLIQYPTLCIKQHGKNHLLICKNGHRRILAARKLGWKQIECTIMSFDSAKEELYHSINANLSDDVFYLDLAEAYQETSNLGESDQEIARRVGVNPRTVGWYRRLTKISDASKKMIRSHPSLFNATWAIKLARKGELPGSNILEPWLKRMIDTGRASIDYHDVIERKGATSTSADTKEKARARIKTLFTGSSGTQNLKWARNFLIQLHEAGFLTKSSLENITKAFMMTNNPQQKESRADEAVEYSSP
ncbi:MAG: ParB N-terminal domain-containing protein [Oligoflexales bacterium]|nr:ParB N-terminal domain-containing protein [Oligoflexales bacterium]